MSTTARELYFTNFFIKKKFIWNTFPGRLGFFFKWGQTKDGGCQRRDINNKWEESRKARQSFKT